MAETALALMEIEYIRGRLPETLQWTSKALLHALAAGRPREATEAAAARRRAIAKLQTKGNLAAVARLSA